MLINLFTVFAYSSKPPTGKLGRQKKKKNQQPLHHLILPWVLRIYMQEHIKRLEKLKHPCIFNFSWQKVNVSKPADSSPPHAIPEGTVIYLHRDSTFKTRVWIPRKPSERYKNVYYSYQIIIVTHCKDKFRPVFKHWCDG